MNKMFVRYITPISVAFALMAVAPLSSCSDDSSTPTFSSGDATKSFLAENLSEYSPKAVNGWVGEGCQDESGNKQCKNGDVVVVTYGGQREVAESTYMAVRRLNELDGVTVHFIRARDIDQNSQDVAIQPYVIGGSKYEATIVETEYGVVGQRVVDKVDLENLVYNDVKSVIDRLNR